MENELFEPSLWIKYNELNDYNSTTQELTRSLLESTRNKLKTYGLTEDICLVTTGSDGREEKSIISPLEVVVLYQGMNLESINNLADKIICENEEITRDNIEIKDINRDSGILFRNDSSRSFPTRPLDSSYLAGDFDLYRRYRNSIIKEIEGKEGKKKLLRFDDKRRQHKKLLEDHLNKSSNRHIDVEKSMLFYNPDENISNSSFSTKQTHMRPFQYKLASDTFKYLRKTNNSSFLDEFPNNTIDRLDFLISTGLTNLSQDETNELKWAYTRAMFWYHLSEENYNLRSNTSVEVDKEMLNYLSRVINDFSKRKSIFD